MRRLITVLLSLVFVLSVPAPDARAQAPTPKVTISGFIDHVTAWTKNISQVDHNLDKTGDTEWYARTRFRPDLSFELGRTKAVFALEIDAAWGATGAGGSDIAAPQRFGETHSHDLNTDTAGVMEIKWMYTEFDAPLLPPNMWRWRVGAQPWRLTYKPGILATGDFGGFNWDFNWTPIFKTQLIYAQIEEESTGFRDGWPNGDDFVLFGAAEISPFKGLDIKPIGGYLYADGTTSGTARTGGRGGVSNSAAFFPLGAQEHRFYAGVDMRFRIGAFYVDPSVIWQGGTREIAHFGTAGTPPREQAMSSWLFDLLVGFQTGPWLIEARASQTTGNKAHHDVRDPRTDVHFYQPVSVDGNNWATWGEHFASNIDYLSVMRSNPASSGVTPSSQTGWDKYGIMKFGLRTRYSVTPAFIPRIGVLTNFTTQKIDNNGPFVVATGVTPAGDRRGDHRYLGTEVDVGFQYRFAPGIAFDWFFAYTFAGPALAHATSTNFLSGAVRDANNPENITSSGVRLRYTF